MKLALVLQGMAVALAYTHRAPATFSWRNSDTAVDAEAPVSFTISVHQQNLDKIKESVKLISNPKSPKYGQFLSGGMINLLTKPAAEDLEAVTAWLDGAGVTYALENDRDVRVSSTVKAASILLSTEFKYLEHDGFESRVLRAGDWTLPDKVENAVEALWGLHGLPLLPRKHPRVGRNYGSDELATPSVLESTYKIAGVNVSGTTANKQAVLEFMALETNVTDLATFFQRYVSNAAPGDDKIYKIVTDIFNGFPSVEGNLDIQYIMGVAPGVKSEYYVNNFADFCGGLKNITESILADDNGPIVLSMSWGAQCDPSAVCTEEKIQTIDNNFAKLAAKGVSVVIASGDSGSGWDGKSLWASWPSTSPYVTAVGATRFQDHKVGQPEIAVDEFGSGGGFSNQFNQSEASWQAEAVNAYTSNPPQNPKQPPASLFNAQGRATPDVSALGWAYPVVVNGLVIPVAGTSASAPAFAAMVSLLNEARIQKGKKQLGFLNPFLYQNADAFTDVVEGTNAISRQGTSYPYGFACGKGWDPVTGLGTPKFDKLLAAVLKLK